MSKITRKTAIQFGSSAGANEIAQFGSLAASAPLTYSGATADPAVIQGLANWLDGWFAGVETGNSPAIEDMNGFCYVMAYQIAYAMQTGVPEWDSATTYYIGSVVQNGTGALFISNTNANLNNAVTDPVNWTAYNAATASSAAKLTTARNINGVAFDGTASITVTAAAGSLTGATLASNVLASSLTSVGTLSSLTVSGGIQAENGSSSVPSYSFTSSTNTGMYFNGTNMNFSLAGTNILSMTSIGLGVTGGVYGSLGSLSAVTYGFAGFANSGMYSSSGSDIRFSIGGNLSGVLTYSSGGVLQMNTVIVGNGTSSAAALATGAANTGFGGDGGGVLYGWTNGTLALTIDTSQNSTFAGTVTSNGVIVGSASNTIKAQAIDTGAAASLVLKTNGTTAISISTAQISTLVNLVVGTNNLGSSSFKNVFGYNTTAQVPLGVYNQDTTNGSSVAIFATGVTEGTASTADLIACYTNAASKRVFQVSTQGVTTIGSTGTSQILGINNGTTAAGVVTVAITNAPSGVGATPADYLKINYNGTTRYIPLLG